MITEQWEIAVVPFPFTDFAGDKRRPALVLSKRSFNARGHTVLAMITSSTHAPWPSDIAIGDFEAAGLRVGCKVRLKLFTLDNRLILKSVGHLSNADREAACNSLSLNLF